MNHGSSWLSPGTGTTEDCLTPSFVPSTITSSPCVEKEQLRLGPSKGQETASPCMSSKHTKKMPNTKELLAPVKI